WRRGALSRGVPRDGGGNAKARWQVCGKIREADILLRGSTDGVRAIGMIKSLSHECVVAPRTPLRACAEAVAAMMGDVGCPLDDMRIAAVQQHRKLKFSGPGSILRIRVTSPLSNKATERASKPRSAMTKTEVLALAAVGANRLREGRWSDDWRQLVLD